MANVSEAVLEQLLHRARSAASAYRSALHDNLPEQDARWLRQGADEHEQNVRLLLPHIEDHLAGKVVGWLEAAVSATGTKLSAMAGKAQLMAHLAAAEQHLCAALDQVLHKASLKVEFKALCEDQLACANTRLSHLRQRQRSAAHPGATVPGPTPEVDTGQTINAPRPASAEHSDL